MSKELYLLRHAKSSWDNPSVGDRERPLNNRGRRDAPRMGAALAEFIEPRVVHVSPALRAQLTLGGLQDGWPDLQGFEHRTEESLYTFSAGDLVDWIGTQSDELPALFLIGHNPGMTDLINWICGETVMANLPTAGFAWLSLAVNGWSELAPGCGRLRTRVFPKELTEP